MIKPICDYCQKELDEFGGLLLSPPDESNKCQKFHICKLCYQKLEQLKEENEKLKDEIKKLKHKYMELDEKYIRLISDEDS